MAQKFSNAELTIKVTATKWKWGLRLPDGEGEGHRLFSTLDSSQRAPSSAGTPRATTIRVDNPLVVPVNKKVRIITTTNDVIHSWMVPSFGVKAGCHPRFVRDTWFRAEQVGDYYGQCVGCAARQRTCRST